MTIDDIAKELNISKTTVSRAISGKGRISEATRQRVMSYISEINYRPSAIAKSLATSKTANIGFIMPSESDIMDMPFFQMCMWGITSAAARRDYDVFVSMASSDDISGLIRLIENHKVDGVLLGRTYSDDKAIDYLMNRQIPFVTIGSTDIGGVVQVDNDDVGGCTEMTELLLLKGLRRLALIGGDSTHVVNINRLKGFLDGHKRAGIKPDNELVHMDVIGMYMIEKTVKELLEKRVDCIIGMDDAICNAVLTNLVVAGLKIPGDIRVASFFNTSILDHYQPQITSLKYDVVKLGTMACDTLLNLLDGQDIDGRQLLNYEVLMKESTQII